MQEIEITWEEFRRRYSARDIDTTIDLNKGHGLMKLDVAPIEWRITIKIVTWLSLLAFPVAFVLFFFVMWLIPLGIVFVASLFLKAIREESARAVVKISLEDPMFYNVAIMTGTMMIFEKY